MELVASAKMRRATQAMLASRPYAARAWDLLQNLALRTEPEAHSLLRTGTGKRLGLVLVSSNRGLVGGFNAQLISSVVEYLKKNAVAPEIVLFGKKGRMIVTKYGYPAAADFEKLDIVMNIEEVRPLAKLVTVDFQSGKYDRIVLAYTDFVSTLIQKPKIRQLLPLEESRDLGTVRGSGERTMNTHFEYVFEPDAEVVLEALLPRLVEMQIYQAVLESTASEHASRMVAMRNASDAAADLIDDLTLSYNQARQAGITQDLAEISASRAALEG